MPMPIQLNFDFCYQGNNGLDAGIIIIVMHNNSCNTLVLELETLLQYIVYSDFSYISKNFTNGDTYHINYVLTVYCSC